MFWISSQIYFSLSCLFQEIVSYFPTCWSKKPESHPYLFSLPKLYVQFVNNMSPMSPSSSISLTYLSLPTHLPLHFSALHLSKESSIDYSNNLWADLLLLLLPHRLLSHTVARFTFLEHTRCHWITDVTNYKPYRYFIHYQERGNSASYANTIWL